MTVDAARKHGQNGRSSLLLHTQRQVRCDVSGLSFRATQSKAFEAAVDDQPSSSLLPTSLTSFVGRDVVIREVLSLLDDEETRLLTLMGPGGVGKTRLGIEVARHLEPDFADGATYLRLASFDDPELVLPALALLAGVRERAGRRLLDLTVSALRDHHLLLVLDNFEHLLALAPEWLEEILANCPRIKILVTSRIALNMNGEQRYLLRPLSIPESSGAMNMAESAAVTLFVQRARAVRPDFAVDGSNTEATEEIC